jgi:hypothetical protein
LSDHAAGFLHAGYLSSATASKLSHLEFRSSTCNN